MIYKAIKGSHITDQEAQLYGDRIGMLVEDQNGGVTTQLVVEDASKVDSPLHGFFEWDNGVAAEKYRKEQAGYLLRSITVVVETDGKKLDTRAFYNVVVTIAEEEEDKEEETARVYVQLDRVLSELDIRQQVIEQALKALISWRKKYEQYKEFGPIMSIIEKVTKELT